MEKYNSLLDGDQYHNDDLTIVDQPLIRVNRVTVNYTAAARRNQNYILQNIENEKRYQEKLVHGAKVAAILLTAVI